MSIGTRTNMLRMGARAGPACPMGQPCCFFIPARPGKIAGDERLNQWEAAP